MLSLAKQLVESGQYTAVLLSVEVGASFSQNIAGAEDAILAAWRDNIAFRLPRELQPPDWTSIESGQKIRAALQLWAQSSTRPLVILIDEIDALQDLAFNFNSTSITRWLSQSSKHFSSISRFNRFVRCERL